MKLDSVEREDRVRKPHDDIVLTVSCFNKVIFVGLDHQRMITGGRKRGGDAFEDPLVPMFDHTCLAVQWDWGTDRCAAEGLVYALHPKAYAKNRDLVVKCFNQFR